MTYEEMIDEIRPLAEKLLEIPDEKMDHDAVLLKSFVFMFVGFADQVNKEQRRIIFRAMMPHIDTMWGTIEAWRVRMGLQ